MAGIVCPTPVDGLTLIREIEKRLEHSVKGRAKPENHRVEYPLDPSLLPEWIRSVAYKAEELGYTNVYLFTFSHTWAESCQLWAWSPPTY